MSEEICCGACGYPVHTTKEWACDWCRQAADRIEELEAKLARAIEHFKKLNRRQDCLETFDAVVNEVVETALAELTGGKDE